MALIGHVICSPALGVSPEVVLHRTDSWGTFHSSGSPKGEGIRMAVVSLVP